VAESGNIVMILAPAVPHPGPLPGGERERAG
jgi:hypothetical protein